MNTLKNELRQKYRALRDSFGEEFIQKASESACQSLINIKEFINADTVLLYYPTKNEISPLPLFELCLKMTKTVAFPVCKTENSTLIYKKINKLDNLSPSTFGLLEPNGDCEEIHCSENTICIVPALLFSREGHRIGYGKGFYDRFLANFEGTSVGFSYSLTLCDEIPKDKYDIPLNMIITESEVLKIASKN
jgi:5-formyltetrahydrofolate cyclo-ligase